MWRPRTTPAFALVSVRDDEPTDTSRRMMTAPLAEHRQFLLDRVRCPYVLFVDDDVIVEPDLVERLLAVIRSEGCGFVGSAVIGLSFADDVRPHQQVVEWWDGLWSLSMSCRGAWSGTTTSSTVRRTCGISSGASA